MSVLVIGATGFIGPRLIRRLVARGETVVGMDLNPGAAPFGGAPVGAPVVRGDVTQFEDVMRTVLDVKPDRLINLAYGLGAGEGNPHQVMRLDILGMDNCFEAMRKDDWNALDDALADDLIYVHSTARKESKAEHVGNLRAGRPHYRGIAPRERHARVVGDVGVVNGISEMHVERDGKEQRFTVRYLAVYVKTAAQWRMISWQSTKVPEA